MATRNVGRMGQYSGFVTRAMALIMDLLIIMVTVAVINAVIALPLVYFLNIDPRTCAQAAGVAHTMTAALCRSVNVTWVLVAIFTGPIYFIALFTFSGQTIGKYVMGVRVVRLDGRAMAVSTSAMRYLGYFVSLLPLGLGFVWVIVDERRQGFHDHMAGTSVIYAWRATGNELLVGRIRRRFRRRWQPAATTTTVTATVSDNQPREIVALAVPSLARVSELLNLLNDMIARHTIAVIGTAVVAKSANGQIGKLGISDLGAGDNQAALIANAVQLTPEQNRALAHDLPADSFIVVVMLGDQWADILVKQVSRQTAAVIRRYDPDANAQTLQTVVGAG
jgi:uncharacterized RDD family membrane protein YckC